MADSPSFNLVSEPWIRVTTLEGEPAELGLRDLLLQAHHLRGLSNELPIMDFAILRVLLAIVQRSVDSWVEECEDSFELWDRIRGAEQFPEELVGTYLRTWLHRFDLFDVERPWMQVPRLETANGKVPDTRRLRIVSENKAALFSAQLEPDEQVEGLCRPEAPLTMDFDEAVRWLVTVQAFDTAGIKTGVTSDPKAKNGKRSGGSTGWAGSIGGLYVEGENLFDTLTLNLHLGRRANESEEFFAEEDLPAWERDLDELFVEGREPDGLADLYTWQSRKVRLVPEDDRVTGIILTYGAPLDVQNRQNLEPMSRWRLNPNLSKKRGALVYLPVRHDPERALWRGIGSLLPQANEGAESEVAPPGILQWLGQLARARMGGLSEDVQLLNVRSAGLSYGTQSACITEMVDDALRLPLALLDAQNADLLAMVRSCVVQTEEAVGAYARFANGLARLQGASKDDAGTQRSRAAEEAYAALGALFDEWVSALGPSTDVVQARTDWFGRAGSELRKLARERVAQAGPRALTGRTIDGHWNSAATQEVWLRRQIGELMPTEPQEPGEANHEEA